MFKAYSSTFLKNFIRISGATIIASFVSATYYRPILDRSNYHHRHSSSSSNNNNKEEEEEVAEKDNDRHYHHDNTNHHHHRITLQTEPNRQHEFMCSNEKPLFTRDETPFWFNIARHISIGVTAIAIRIFMTTYGEYEIVNDENYHHFLELVIGGKGREEKQQGMITVSNHRTLFDDPGVVSCLLPLSIGIQPKYNRWGICSQEYCFTDKLPAFIKGYFGAGQVLPIKRGGGINQTFFKDFSTFIARGEWCHIFPEGGTWQWNELGGRGRGRYPGAVRDYSKSKLKWGVGKLIAHAPTRPRVIPFAHVGMESLLPQDPISGKTMLKTRWFGGGETLKVRIKFGEEIFFDDLIEEYEKSHGTLWKFKENNDKWISSESEKHLYKKITLRIEEHLEKLTKEVVCKE